MFSLKNKIALVIGGTGKIGFEISCAMAAQGAKVYVASRSVKLDPEISDIFSQLDIESIDFNESYIYRKDNNIHYYFSSIHSNEMVEPYIDNIYTLLEKNGWHVIKEYTPHTNLLPKLYTWYICLKNN